MSRRKIEARSVTITDEWGAQRVVGGFGSVKKPERWALYARYRTHKTGMWFAGYECSADEISLISFTNQKTHAWKFHSFEAARDRAKSLRDRGYTVIVHKV